VHAYLFHLFITPLPFLVLPVCRAAPVKYRVLDFSPALWYFMPPAAAGKESTWPHIPGGGGCTGYHTVQRFDQIRVLRAYVILSISV